ncbi:MAG: hypothetical protein KatS3mg031_0869 [Chitinophagales bacterium]|nr:MAG: hypothetical protein KatS3mg031_0869 [Chitinophagales bacterium]
MQSEYCRAINFLLTLIPVLLCFPVKGQELQPTLTDALLQVLVIDAARKPQEGEVVSFINVSDTTKKFTGITDAEGRFSILIPKGQKYKVQYKVFSTEQDFKPLDIPAAEGLLTFDYTITVLPPKVYRLDNVFFASGEAALSRQSLRELDELAEYMKRKKTLIIEIAGHTDNVGDPTSNQKLSEARANSVRNYLLKKGIAPERVIAKGYGDTQPVADNGTPEGRQQNRRTEVRIISQ